MKSALTYTRITGKAVKAALIKDKGYSGEELPSVNPFGNMLNRLGYHLKRVLKSEPQKKIPEVDDIFENVWAVNRHSQCGQ